MKKEYKIVEDFVGKKNKFCRSCGAKNSIFPTKNFDGKTGQALAILQCMNTECDVGKGNILEERQDNCDHDLETVWFFLFPDGKRCKKCQYYESDLDSGI